jgi:hypothetical protein
LGEKPVRWDYFQSPLRLKLYKTFQALLRLRNENEIFRSTSTTVTQQLLNETKRIAFSHSSMNVILVGNFDVVARSIDPNFQHGGNWYDYFSGDTVQTTGTNESIWLKAGEFHIYTDKKLATPEADILNPINKPALDTALDFALQQNYPNPFNPVTSITFHLPVTARVTLKIFDLLGREVRALLENENIRGTFTAHWDGRNRQGKLLSSGVYLYKLQARAGGSLIFEQNRKMILLK